LPSEPIWLEPAEVVELNRLIVAETGEPFAVRDAGLLASALDRPRNCWLYDRENDALTLAVTLLFGIARNHPFVQGNKRTGFEAALGFLENNGYALEAPNEVGVAHLITDVISHTTTEAEFTEEMRPFLHPLS
jgi:death-on-curing protein